MGGRLHLLAVWGITALCVTSVARAEGSAGKRYAEFRNDNDFWLPAGTDRYYTNGLFVTALYPGEGPLWPKIFDDLAGLAGKCGEDADLCFRSHGYAVNHLMFTPTNLKETAFIADDHPYAGYLSVSAILNVDRISKEGCRRLGDCVFNEFEGQLGAVGKASMAENAQIWWHARIGAQRPMGWDNQLRGKVGMLLRARRTWPLRQETTGLALELAPFAEVAAGNIAVYGRGGVRAKIGSDPNDEPARGQWMDQKKFSWQVFGEVAGGAVAHNYFISGNTFSSPTGLAVSTFVADARGGVALRLGFLRMSYTLVWQSKEFEVQEKAHTYGIVRLGVVY